MYSRNISFPERVKGVREIRTGESRVPSAIPVKSYTDRSAYEHFGNIGKENSEVREKMPTVSSSFVPLNDESRGENQEIVSLVESKKSEVTEITETNGENNKNKQDDISLTELFGNLKSLFNSDLILPVFAIMLFLLGEKESNNIITSLALISVMLI